MNFGRGELQSVVRMFLKGHFCFAIVALRTSPRLGLTKAVGIAAECLAGWHRSNCRCSSARGLGTDQQSQRRLAWTFSPAPDGIYEGSDASSTQPPPLQPSGLRDLLCWHSFFDVPHAHVVMCRRLGTAECCQDWVWEDPFVGMDHKGVPGTQSCCGLAF